AQSERSDASSASRRSLAAQQGAHGQSDDLQIQAERPVADVVVVPLHPFGQRGRPSQPVHLSPAADPRLDPVAVTVPEDVVAKYLDELGALGAGADHAHLTAQD